MKMNHYKKIITLGLPKTGQTVSYQAEDDGDYEAGWWVGRKNANNKTRFVAKIINGDNVVVDLASGLMWAADGNESGCNNGFGINWSNGIAYANALDFAGFTNWRMPNARELFSISNLGYNNPSIHGGFFMNTHSFTYWSSSTYHVVTSFAWSVHFQNGVVSAYPKSGAYYLRCVRGGL
jgi:hypothetical protein